MLLQQIKAYLQTQPSISLQQLSWKFDTDPEALRPLLARWLHTGKLTRLDNTCAGSGCQSGCGSCQRAPEEVYRWIG